MTASGLEPIAARIPGHAYGERRPIAPLAAHVSCVWTQRVGAASAPYAHRAVPNGCVELLYAPGSMPRVSGPLTGPIEEVLAPGSTVVGVRFRPALTVNELTAAGCSRAPGQNAARA